MGCSWSKSHVGERCPTSCKAGELSWQEVRKGSQRAAQITGTVSGKSLVGESSYRGLSLKNLISLKGLHALRKACTPQELGEPSRRSQCANPVPWMKKSSGLGSLFSNRGVRATRRLPVWWIYRINLETIGTPVFAFCFQATSL